MPVGPDDAAPLSHGGSPGPAPRAGDAGDRGPPAADFPRAFVIELIAEGNRLEAQSVREYLAQLRAAVFGES